MVLKSDDRHVKQITLQNNVLDQTALSLLCIKVYQFQTLHGSLLCLIIISQKLISSADGNDNTIVLHISLEILLNLLKFLTYQHLLSVRTTAQKHDVQTGKFNLIIQFKRNRLCLNSSPLAPFHQTLDVSPVTIKVQQIRV